ncbi:hypothetical protein SAMN05421835_105144 [Amycolatopsis sacchari]|uniref:Uncharacterized protein n=1 Tax=Amycolatopsis sacchari TaxID=115433 RepID=A0A1I3R5S5_9PSEU|nr:hypothetical protein [Amycolatopsis sacchari]SFJ41400.1 hypothetical protein SAMN05421835_105144 [Amycolatopsis sacchari]
MGRRTDPGQLDLFGPQPVSAPVPGRACPPPRSPRRAASVTPTVAHDVLAEIQEGRYGALDDSDRIVVFEDTDRVRLATDEDTVHELLTGGYVQRCPPREAVSCLHGAIRRPVAPLRLTRQGRALLHRWSALKPY